MGLVVTYAFAAAEAILARGLTARVRAVDDEGSAAHCGGFDTGEAGCILPASDHERGADGALCALKLQLPAGAAWPAGLPPCA